MADDWECRASVLQLELDEAKAECEELRKRVQELVAERDELKCKPYLMK